MRHQDYGAALGVELFEDLEHFVARVTVERASRFIGEDNLAPVDQRASDRDALLLAARKLVRPVMRPPRHAELHKQTFGEIPAALARDAGVNRRYLDIAAGVEFGQQMVALEDEPEMFAAEFGLLIGVERRD